MECEEKEKIKQGISKKCIIIGIVVISIILLLSIGIGVVFLLWPIDTEKIKDSVVKIEVYDKNSDLIATGSGFCIFDEHTIVTNYHVIEGAYKISITTDNNTKVKVTKCTIFNKGKDIALLKISTSMKPLSIDNMSKLKIRQNVIAIGSPMGELNTVSEGKITNLDVKNEIRISAPISHGSSGGVLLNERGKVIGITNAGYDEAQNLNFAIPIYIAKDLYESVSKIKLTSNQYSSSIGNVKVRDEDLIKNLLDDDKNYYTENIESIYYISNDFAKFDETLLNASDNMCTYYKNLSIINRRKAFDYFLELGDYDNASNLSSLIVNINSWSIYEWVLNLGILERWELAIVIINIEGKDLNQIKQFIINLPIKANQKALLCAFYGAVPTNLWSQNTKREVFNFINSLSISASNKKIIFNKIFSSF